MELDYVPTRMEILSAQGLEEILIRQGKSVPEYIHYEAAWDLDDAWDSARRVRERAATTQRR